MKVSKHIFNPNSYIKFVANCAAPLLNRIEFGSSNSRAEYKNEYSPLFIIGSPRTGSTVLYQMLTYSLKSLYISNFISLFHRALPSGISLSMKLFGDNVHTSFESTYGNTRDWCSPSECPAFWFRWFSREDDFVEFDGLSSQQVDAIRRNIYTPMGKYKRGMIFKNLTSGQRLQVLIKALPNAKFIYLRRDPFFSLQSLLKAREKLGIKQETWWSVKPKNHRELNQMSLLDKLVNQIYYHEKQIIEDLNLVSDENKYILDYSLISENYDELLQFTGFEKRQDLDLSTFNFQNKVTLNEKLQNELIIAMSKKNWKDLEYDG